ncbi:cytochrome b [Xylophilus sp. Kf1]|nr:cytochrome b [Xylophilus sp. Kf1]
MKVWDPLVRVVHWGVAAGIASAWWSLDHAGGWHERLGYAVAALVLVRLAWGLVGSRHARFADFVAGPAATAAYARRLLRGTEERHLGHNPLGGWMALALWAGVLATCLTGWMFTTDAFFGMAWVENTHQALAWTVVGLLPLHLAGVLFTSLRHRENLLVAMITGRKPERPPAGASGSPRD